MQTWSCPRCDLGQCLIYPCYTRPDCICDLHHLRLVVTCSLRCSSRWAACCTHQGEGIWQGQLEAPREPGSAEKEISCWNPAPGGPASQHCSNCHLRVCWATPTHDCALDARPTLDGFFFRSFPRRRHLCALRAACHCHCHCNCNFSPRFAVPSLAVTVTRLLTDPKLASIPDLNSATCISHPLCQLTTLPRTWHLSAQQIGLALHLRSSAVPPPRLDLAHCSVPASTSIPTDGTLTPSWLPKDAPVILSLLRHYPRRPSIEEIGLCNISFPAIAAPKRSPPPWLLPLPNLLYMSTQPSDAPCFTYT